MNVTSPASHYQKPRTLHRSVAVASTGDPSKPEQAPTFSSTEASERFSEAFSDFAAGSVPGWGAFEHLASDLACSVVGCNLKKRQAISAGFLANIAGTIALGAAAFTGGGPIIGAVTGTLLATSGLCNSFVRGR